LSRRPDAGGTPAVRQVRIAGILPAPQGGWRCEPGAGGTPAVQQVRNPVQVLVLRL